LIESRFFITESDVQGYIYALVGYTWMQPGVAKLWSKIAKNGYRILYLTARPLILVMI